MLWALADDEGCHFGHHFLMVGKRFVENTSSCRIELSTLLFINYTKPSVSAFGQPLWMATHVSDWGNLLNPRCRGGKRLTMVVMFVGCLVLGDDPNIILFLPYKTYGAGVFLFPPEPK
jgi:hypothetical protein